MDERWEIRRYVDADKDAWDRFVEDSRNATFLFKRDYMDYHADRFADHSLMAYRNGKLVALLPANILEDTLYSHQGLSYGGWLLGASPLLDMASVSRMWRQWLHYCYNAGIRRIIYKPLPYIYCKMPSQEDLYMLFLAGATLISTEISSTIDLRRNPGFNKLQRRHLKKAGADFYGHIITAETPEYVSRFYSLLSTCLSDRHATVPVHTRDELQLLMDRFPDNIRIWGAYSDSGADGMLAGICMYETEECAHCQYIATSSEGRRQNILAPLVSELIEYYYAQGYRYFDFGISTEENGRFLNVGLNRQKTSYGASGTAFLRYDISVDEAMRNLKEKDG